MKARAMSFSTSAKLLVAAPVLIALGAAPAHAQMAQEEPDAEDVARTPLEDFNIDSDDLPEVLVIAAEDPYASEGLDTCNLIVGEIAKLDQVLGADFDIAGESEGGISRGRVAQSVVGSFIPFRGIVREVSGANERRRQFNLAVTAGMVRRGYLKGLGHERGCRYPARPREDRTNPPGSE